MKRMLALSAVALALGGCAAGYYDGYGYGGSGYGYDAWGNPVYSGPAQDNYYYGQPWYSEPSGSLGFFYYDNGGQRHWRERDRSGQWSDHRADGDSGHWPGQANRSGNWVERRDNDNGGRNLRDRDGNAYSVPDPRMSGPNPPGSGRVTVQNPDGSQTQMTPAEAARR